MVLILKFRTLILGGLGSSMRYLLLFILFVALSSSGFAQFGFLGGKGPRHSRTASNKAAQRVVVEHRDAFMRKSKKGPNVKATSKRRKSPFSSQRKKNSFYYGKKTKSKKGGAFQARKSNYKAIKKSSGDAFTRNPKKSSGRGGGRAGGKRGKRR